MFNGLNLNNKLDVKIELWRNKDDILSEIPVEWCKEINYTFGEPTQLQLEIPKYVMRNNKKILNNLYNKIKIRHQLIVDVNGDKERFIITEQSTNLNKHVGSKSFTCYSFEKTLENARVNFLNTITRTLVKDELYVHDGLLDEVIKVIPSWKLGYIDDDAKMITEMANETKIVNVYEKLVNNKIEVDGLIWEKDVVTDVSKEYAVNIQIDYHNLKTYSEDGKLLKTENLSTILKPLYTNVKHIKAFHHSETGNRYGIKYILTLSDGTEFEQIHTFTNVVNKKIESEIKLVYETGAIVEGTRAKFISIDPTNDNVLNFMNVLQEQFQCIFKYDTINKVIDCYAKKNIGKDKPIELSFDTNVVSVDITPDSEVPNCLIVESSNDISIMDMNPYGGNYLYNYKWYIENDFFTDNLINSLDKYEKILASKQDEYMTLKRNGDTLYSSKTKYDSEIYSLENRIKYYNNLLAGFIAVGDSSEQQAQVKSEITALETRLNECIRERNSLQEQILQIEDDMVKISEEIQKDKVIDSEGNRVFTDNDLVLLEELTFTSIYEDSYYTTSFGLYNNALKVFEEIIKPQAEFTIECANLVKLIKNDLKNVIELGSFFMVDTDDIPELEEGRVRFIGYTLLPSEKKIGSTLFTNKEFKKDNLNLAANIGQKVAKSTSTISSWQQVVEDAMLSNDYVSKLVDGGLDLATTQINSRTDTNIIDFSEYGSFWKDANDPTNGNQVYIGNSLIAISSDGFKTSDVAITGNGIIAETVIGKLLLGSKCEIATPDGLFVIGNNKDNTRIGLNISDSLSRDRIFLGLEKLSDGTQFAKLELKDEKGREVVISEKGIISHNQYQISDNLDSTHPMYAYLNVDEGVFEVRKVNLFLKIQKYRAFEKGMESGGSTQTSGGGGGFSISASGGDISVSVTTPQKDIFSSAESVDEGNIYNDSGLTRLHNHAVGHSHDFNFSTYHTHNISQDPHTHTLDTSHLHSLQYGIFEDTQTPGNVKVYVNNELVKQGITTDTNIDITKYIALNKLNEIRIETDKNIRCLCNIFTKMFVGY